MEKKKKKYYKDGNTDVFRFFNSRQWKNMSEREKAQWTEFSEDDMAPIPKEVIEFKEKIKPEVVEVNVDEIDTSEPVDEKTILKEELRKLGIRFAHNASLARLKEQLKEAQDATD